MGERKIAACIECGEERELAAHGLCFKCYRRQERSAENPWAAADRHNRGKLKAQKKLRTAITAILNAVDGVIEFMDNKHVEAIRGVCGHYLLGLASGLPLLPATNAAEVSSERDDAVNCSQEDGSVTVNCEPTPNVNRSPSKVEGAPNTEQAANVPDSSVAGTVNSEHDRAVNCSQEPVANEPKYGKTGTPS